MQYQAMMAELIQAIAHTVIIDGSQFNAVRQEVQTWNEITFLLHTVNIIAQFSGALPAGKKGAGYFNLQHNQGFSGDICMQNCVYIAFVVRSFMLIGHGCNYFLNRQGEIMFKIFVGRDKKRPLKTEQLSSLAQHFGSA